MAFVVTTFDDEAALENYMSAGTVHLYKNEYELDIALEALTTETITKLFAKGAFYVLVLDGAFSGNTLIDILPKGYKLTVVEETP